MYAVATSASLDKKIEQACLALTTSASKLYACGWKMRGVTKAASTGAKNQYHVEVCLRYPIPVYQETGTIMLVSMLIC